MAELMTMRDIAGLARVQRPVVTVWRRRARGSVHPFPAAQLHRDGQEFFLRADVVAWLEATQRGNNPDVRADAATHTLLASSGVAEANALSALITLRHLTGEPLGSHTGDELLDLADASDPDDRYLLSELAGADDVASLAAAAEDLVEAAWGELAAHRRLVDARLRPPGSALARLALTEPAGRLLLAIFGPLTRELGQPSVMDPTGCAGDVFAEIVAALESPVLLMDGDSAAHRLTRRQLLLVDASTRAVGWGVGDWSVTGPVAHLVLLPDAAEPDASPLEQLAMIDEIALQLDQGQLALCLAPAEVLTDPLSGAALARRDQLLRDGYLRAIVRLPAGLRPAQSREHLALWLLGPADPAQPAERRTLVADVSRLAVRECSGLADDLLAAWQGADGARRRAWAHLHPILTRDLVSASGTLVPRPPARANRSSRAGADWVVELRSADAAGWLSDYRFEVADGPAALVTLARALEQGWLRMIPGRKLLLDGLPPGNVAVVSGDLVASSPASRLAEAAEITVDRLALLARADVELTEPGDVVFTVRPTPHAVVDPHGGALVLAPARVLRVRPNAPLLPLAIAARINQSTSTDWRGWTVAEFEQPDRDALGEALAELEQRRARLVANLAAVDALTRDLTTAVESRQLRITKENHGPTQG